MVRRCRPPHQDLVETGTTVARRFSHELTVGFSRASSVVRILCASTEGRHFFVAVASTRYVCFTLGLTEDLLRAVDQSGSSDRRLSMQATGSADTIRNIRRGAKPRIDTIEAICSVLGLAVYIGRARPPPYDEAVDRSPTADSASPCRFRAALQGIAENLRSVGFEVRDPDPGRRRTDEE